MTRIALLKIRDGGFNQGFNVSLQVLKFTSPLPILPRDILGNLPYNPDIEGLYVCWQTNFRNLSQSYTNNRNSQHSNYDDWQIQSTSITNYSTSEGIEACKNFINSLENSIKEWLNAAPKINKDLGRIREQIAVELNNKSESFQIIIQPENAVLYKYNWYAWDLLQQNLDVGISFILPHNNQEEFQQVIPIKKETVRILAVFGDDRNIDYQPDRQEINKLKEKGAEVVYLDKPTAQELIKTLRDKRGWDIFFFAGHSNQKNDTGIIYINEHESLTIKQLQNALTEARLYGLQIAIFNSCKGLGLATQLSDLQIPFIIVMQDVVPDKVAQFFLKEFLTEYAGGNSLPTAVRLAQSRLEEFTYLPGATWLPVMFQSYIGIAPTWQDFLLPKKGDYVESKDKFPWDQYKYIPLAPPRTPKKPKLQKPKLRVVFLISLMVTINLTGVRSLGLFEPSELWAYDNFMRIKPSPQILDERISIIGIDDKDVKNLKENSLTDKAVEELLIKLQKYKPQVIGLDINRFGPTWNQADWEQLGKTIKSIHQPIIAACVVGETKQYQPLFTEEFPPGVPVERISYSDGLKNDDDPYNNKIIRRYVLTMDVDQNSSCPTEYSFSFQVIKHYLSIHTQYSYKQNNHSLQINNLVINALNSNSGGYQKLSEDMKGYQMLINYRSYSQTRKPVSLNQIMMAKDSDLQKLIHNKIVLIGYVLSDNYENNDYHITPIGKLHGVKIHAQIINQILDAIENDKPLLTPCTKTVEFFWIFSCAVFGGFFGVLFSSLLRLTISVVVANLLLSLICFIYFTSGLWIPVIICCLSFSTNSYLLYLCNFFKINLGFKNYFRVR